ncbi:MAG: hypothetical protein GY863_09625, partial [bacterium]|nr:hypothetical protein [bacterium]
ESGLREKEIQNRNAEKVNSLGSYFPEKLDNAPPESKSSSDNPFFTEVIVPNGFPFGGWEKGKDINTYSLLNDSTEYIYDPKKGAFFIKKK